jgi:hypothetical protein
MQSHATNDVKPATSLWEEISQQNNIKMQHLKLEAIYQDPTNLTNKNLESLMTI